MRRFLAGLSLVLFSGVVYAQCTTQTYNIDGRLIVCTVCCYGGSCTTTCI